MFNELIIKAVPELVKYFASLSLGFYYSKPQVKHMQAFVIAMLLQGYKGKISHVSELALNSSRTSEGRFLESPAWDEQYLLKTLNKHVLARITKKSKETRQPVYVIIDDTICEKTVPSSKAKRPIEGCGFHRSHLQNRTVYGHQFVAAMLRCGDLVLPYNIVLYEKGECRKIKLACDIVASLPPPSLCGYIMADSWYSCKAIVCAANAAGYHFIGALKSNRIIYPRPYRKKGIQLGVYARSLHLGDFDLVTVNKRRYYFHTYLGRINGAGKVKVAITWPVAAFRSRKAMKAFVSTDIKMSGFQLVRHYAKRWPIEVFFREANRSLGMKQCQVHSKKAIIRYQYILILAYTFCGLEVNGEMLAFSKRRRAFQRNIKRFQLSWIFTQAQNHLPLDAVLAAFHLSFDIA